MHNRRNVHGYIVPYVALYIHVPGLCALFGTLHLDIFTAIFRAVNLGMDQLLILSDLDFIFAMKDYFTKVADDAKAKVDSSKSESRNRDRTTQSSASAALEPSLGEQTSASILPKIKVVADIRNLCVAIVESGNTEEPQALQLKVWLIVCLVLSRFAWC